MATGIGNQYGDLQEVIERLRADPNKVSMGGGRQYTQVASRVEALRIVMGLRLSIETEILFYPGPMSFKEGPADTIVVRAVIREESGRILATGHAEEVRGSTRINATSALENCETSAIGRALAALGVHGGEFASINEVDIAKDKEARGVGKAKTTEAAPAHNGSMEAQPAGLPPVLTRVEVPPKHENSVKMMAHFANECEDVKVLREFWDKNTKLVNDIRDTDLPSFQMIKEIFAKRSMELSQ
jgi:hypothetical protein